MNLGTAQVIRANARDLPLADDSVDLVVTSPPYFALRSYQDGGEHYSGQIGDEPTPAEFVDSLLEVTRECVRVLKPTGSLWVNLGDKYSTGNSGQSAAFPTEWPRRIIAGWSPSRVCVECGEGRRPVASVTPVESKPFAARQGLEAGRTWNGNGGNDKRGLGYAAAERDRTITGYACACPEPTAPTTPAVVLDPFGGTGTTAMVAKALGRHGISVDMSADYCRLAEWRTNDRDQLAKVLGIAKLPAADACQGDLFSLLEEGA